MIYFDLLYLSFPGSLGYIVCQHYESLFVLSIFDILFNMGARWFCLSCIRRDLRSSASCVKRLHETQFVFSFSYIFFTVAACESLIFPVSSVNEVARHPYSTRDCLILLIFQSKTARGGLLVRQA